jgi:hypothetical protein
MKNNHESEVILKESIVAYLNVLTKYSPKETE